MRMKKRLALLLTISLLASLAACGQTGQTDNSFGEVTETAGENATADGEAGSSAETNAEETEESAPALLRYMGQASVRVTTAEGKVIYVDPFSGSDEDYAPAADLILVTHAHPDHNQMDRVANRNPDCRIITQDEAILDGIHQTFDLGYVRVEAVEAGYNQNHSVENCVGYVLTFSNGASVYVSGDTSTTRQMPELAERGIDYAFFCCDGRFNMGLEEAAECAKLVGAKRNIPYHMAPGAENHFDREIAEQFQVENRMIIEPGEDIPVVPVL